MNVEEILHKQGYTPLSRQSKKFTTWLEFFKGNVSDFHTYQDYQGAELGNVTRNRKSLGMAKVISEIWADNIINPETEFYIEDGNDSDEASSDQQWLDDYSDKNGLKSELNDAMELTFALGTFATVQYLDNGSAVNQYVSMEYIFPLRSDNGKIVDCAFASKKSNDVTYIQIHEKHKGKYYIKNLYFDKDGKETEIEDGPERDVTSDVKLFQLHTPALVNNNELGNPLGISVYANAIEELKAVDIAYDALDKEVRNGRMRVYVQGEALVMRKGSEEPVFNKDQDEFFVLPEDAKNPDGTLITVSAPTLRVEQLINNLNKQLNLLGSKCGLGDNAFYSEAGTIYTNTAQVVSTNSKFYKTRVKHATRIEKSIKEMIEALYYLEHNSELDKPIRIDFDDSIIHDKDEEYARSIQLFNLGLISRIQFYQRTMNMSQKEAKEFNKKQIDEMSLSDDFDDEGGEI